MTPVRFPLPNIRYHVDFVCVITYFLIPKAAVQYKLRIQLYLRPDSIASMLGLLYERKPDKYLSITN
jgi:hypothetical protein